MAKKAAKSKKSSSSSASSATAQTNAEPVSKDKMVLRPRSQARQSVSSSEMEEIPKSAMNRKPKLKKKIVKIDAKKPKKPPTAFFYFLEDFRKEFQEQNPDVKKMRDIGKACGEKWKTMTYEEKVKYYDIAAEKRADFDRATAEYIRKKESGEDDEEAEDEDSEFNL